MSSVIPCLSHFRHGPPLILRSAGLLSTPCSPLGADFLLSMTPSLFRPHAFCKNRNFSFLGAVLIRHPAPHHFSFFLSRPLLEFAASPSLLRSPMVPPPLYWPFLMNTCGPTAEYPFLLFNQFRRRWPSISPGPLGLNSCPKTPFRSASQSPFLRFEYLIRVPPFLTNLHLLVVFVPAFLSVPFFNGRLVREPPHRYWRFRSSPPPLAISPRRITISFP